MKSVVTLFLILLSLFTQAQTILSVDDAIKIALKNNYNILVAKNEADILKMENSMGNAGMLPNITVSGSSGYSVNDVNQKMAGGTEKKYSGLTTQYIDAGAELNWTLFDGGKMFVTKSKLNEIELLGNIQFKDKVLQTQYDVVAAYYNVVKQKQELNSINEIINYNTELVKIMEISFNGGSVKKNDLLQSKIDLNVYKENYIVQQYILDVAKKDLNVLLCFKSDSSYEVQDSIPLNYSINKAELIDKLNSANTDILTYQKKLDIAKLNLKEYNRLRYPLINFRTGYYLSNTTNSDGNVLMNNLRGPQIGGSISIPIYEAGKINRQVNIAKIDVESAGYELENTKLQVQNELLNAFSEFEYQKQLIQIEKENNQLTKENLEISYQRLKLGQTTSLEVHQAQENYAQSCTRLIYFEYNLKMVETKLKQLIAIL
jgi:outer membrane protein